MQHLKATKPFATTKEFFLKKLPAKLPLYFLLIFWSFSEFIAQTAKLRIFLILCIGASYVFKHIFVKSICKDNIDVEQSYLILKGQIFCRAIGIDAVWRRPRLRLRQPGGEMIFSNVRKELPGAQRLRGQNHSTHRHENQK